MVKERFLSVFENYVLRTSKCWSDSAKSYAKYIRDANLSAMNELGSPDYLEWMAECSRYDKLKDYVSKLWVSIDLTVIPTCDAKNNRKCAVRALDSFIDDTFGCCYSPPYLGKDESLKKGICYKKNTGLYERVPGLCIGLKNEYIRVVEFARHIFGDMFCEAEYAYIPIILSPEMPITQYMASREYLDKLWERRGERRNYPEDCREFPEDERCDLSDEECEILRSGMLQCRVLAEFHEGAEPKIEIFYRNITASSIDEYLSAIKNCLAHEYMHYLHWCYCKKVGVDSTYRDDEMREGIAEFFAMLFSLYRDGCYDWFFAEKKYLYWAKMLNSGWPYANALCLYRVGNKENFFTEKIWDLMSNGCVEKLLDVLGCSANYAYARNIFDS